jgi:hypothetical protein
MIVTARQLEDLHRQNGGNGQITLPYRARLTPLAIDWVRARKIALGYSDVSEKAEQTAAKPQQVATAPAAISAGGFLWWCDGPCGPAKAAIMAQAKESSLVALDRPADARQLVSVVKEIASRIRGGQCAGAVLLVQNGALASVFTNRCPALRAILGTCLDAVEQGVGQAAANVLIVEYPYKTLVQIRNLLSRFVRGTRALPEDVRRQLEELASCA